MSAAETPRRFLAIDFGDRKTGVAATDWTGTIRVPLETIYADDDDACARAIAEVVRERQTEEIVVGLPLATDGGEGQRAQRTRRFIEVLKGRVQVPVETVDESHTTGEAHERLKAVGIKAARRRRIEDSMAALIILERYLHDRERG